MMTSTVMGLCHEKSASTSGSQRMRSVDLPLAGALIEML